MLWHFPLAKRGIEFLFIIHHAVLYYNMHPPPKKKRKKKKNRNSMIDSDLNSGTISFTLAVHWLEDIDDDN